MICVAFITAALSLRIIRKKTYTHTYMPTHPTPTHAGKALLPRKPAAFVAFNPGFGHPSLSESWEPTLAAAMLQQSPPPRGAVDGALGGGSGQGCAVP